MALVEHGEIVIAVVGNGSTGEIDVCERGEGAWAIRRDSGQRLQATDESHIVTLEACLTSPKLSARARLSSWPPPSELTGGNSDHSPDLTLAYVAEGRIAASVQFSSHALHAGAGSLLASESGAIVTDLDGASWNIDSDTLVASANAELHVELLDLLETHK
jgi:fructose-1,6-bisphosphatase/inositol monophosphatase family enzyme